MGAKAASLLLFFTGVQKGMERHTIAALETAYNKAASGRASVRTGLRLGYALRHYDLHRAEELALAVLQEAESQGLTNQQGWAHRLLGLVATQQGDIHAANFHAKQAMEAFTQTNDSVGIGAVELLQALQQRRQGDQQNVLRLLKKNLKIFTAHHAVELSIESLVIIGGCHAFAGNFDKAEESFREALRLRGNGYTPLAEQLMLALLAESRGQTDEALEQLQQLYLQTIAKGMMVVAGRILHTIASIHSIRGNYPTALEQFHNCLAISQSNKLLPIIADAHQKISIIYKNLRDFASAMHHTERALECAKKLNNRYLESSILNGMGNIHYPLHELGTALDYYQQSLAIAEEIKAFDLISISLENIANILRDSGDIDGAIEYYERGLLSNRNLGDRLGEAHCKFNLGRLYNDIGKPAVAMPYLHEVLSVAEEASNTPLLADVHGELARSWETSGLPDCYREAYRHLRTFMEQREKITGQDRQIEIAKLQQRLAAQESLRQQEQLEHNQQKIEQELRHAEEKLMIAGVQLANKNQILSTLQEQLNQLLSNQEIPSNVAGNIKQLMVRFSLPQGQQDWIEFQEKLEVVHQGFLSRLSQQFPMLNPAELRVCALLRTQLSTKEIANLLNVSERAVEKLRYQSRKKIGLHASQNLSAFLASF